MYAIKPPFNVNSAAQLAAVAALEDKNFIKKSVKHYFFWAKKLKKVFENLNLTIMRKSILLSLSILFAVAIFSQEYATDFTVEDCDGVTHNLFSILDEGKVVVMVWVMP